MSTQHQFAIDIAADMTHPRQVICPIGAHPSFLVDSEVPVGCPWCETNRPRRSQAQGVTISQTMGDVAAGTTVIGYSSRR